MIILRPYRWIRLSTLISIILAMLASYALGLSIVPVDKSVAADMCRAALRSISASREVNLAYYVLSVIPLTLPSVGILFSSWHFGIVGAYHRACIESANVVSISLHNVTADVVLLSIILSLPNSDGLLATCLGIEYVMTKSDAARGALRMILMYTLRSYAILLMLVLAAVLLLSLL